MKVGDLVKSKVRLQEKDGRIGIVVEIKDGLFFEDVESEFNINKINHSINYNNNVLLHKIKTIVYGRMRLLIKLKTINI